MKKKKQLKKILDKTIKKTKILKMSVFQPLISEYIGRKVKYDIRVPVFSKTNTNNFEDFQGLHLYCFE